MLAYLVGNADIMIDRDRPWSLSLHLAASGSRGDLSVAKLLDLLGNNPCVKVMTTYSWCYIDIFPVSQAAYCWLYLYTVYHSLIEGGGRWLLV